MSRLLMREPQRGVVGGVAAGFGDYLQVDPVLVRIGFALLTFVHGIGLLLYLVCWVLMPVRPAGTAAFAGSAASAAAGAGTPSDGFAATAQPAVPSALPAAGAASAQLAVGSVLVFVGVLLLAHNLDWLRWPHWLRFETLWPLLLVALGLGLIGKSRGSQPPA